MAAALTATAAPATITAAAVVTAATAAVPRVNNRGGSRNGGRGYGRPSSVRSANLPAPRVIPTPARRPRPAPRASMMGMILTCSARSNCKIQRKISIWKKSSVFAMRQKKRCSFCTDKKRWRDCRKRSDKSCPPPTVRHFSLCSVLRAGKRMLWQVMVCWNNAMNRVNTMRTTICSRSISRPAP